MKRWKKGLLLLWLAILLGIAGSIFWYSEWQYSLPTPLPSDYKSVSEGTRIELGENFSGSDKPLLLHFFNPDCPCSRFNMKHVKELIKNYGQQVNFVVVLVTDKPVTGQEIQEKYNLGIPVLKDSSIAEKCGVYSTPQAVILTSGKTLYYRGNYNKTRYCTDKKTNYAQIALERLLHNQQSYRFNELALKAYGCQLPGCSE